MLEIPERHGRADAIDILRAVFALWVMFSHTIPWATVAGHAPSGIIEFVDWLLVSVFQPNAEMHPAVLGFIVLSGYCIHRGGLRKDRADVGRFAIRRAFRILPIYVVGIVAGLVGFKIANYLDAPLAQSLTGTDGISAGCIIGRLLTLGNMDPDHYRCMLLGNAPLNTVMVEIWLYVAYPILLLVVAARHGNSALWIVIITAWAAGTLAAELHPEIRNWWDHATIGGFIVIWWIGAAANDFRFLERIRESLPELIVCYIAVTLALSLHLTHSAILTFGREVMTACLMALFVAKSDKHLGPNLRPFSLLGAAGYSIYAFHAPIIYCLLIAGCSWWLAMLAALGGGVVGYVFVEKPMMSIGRKLSQRKLAAA